MAAPVIILVNQTGSDITLEQLAIVVPGSGSIDVSQFNYSYEISNDTELQALVDSGDINITYDGESLTTEQSKEQLSPLPVNLKNNLSAISDPTATDDSVAGYSVGSVWLNLNTQVKFVCFDETASNAVWVSNQGGSSSIRIWSSDAPPETPNAEDDEFSGSTLDPAWTIWNEAGANVSVAIDQDTESLEIVQPGTSGLNRLGGVFRSMPTSPDWTITVKVGIMSERSGSPSGGPISLTGIFIAEDLATNPATSKILALQVRMNQADQGIYIHYYSNYTNQTSNHFNSNENLPDTQAFLRLRVSGTTYWADISPDGETWASVRSNTISSDTGGSFNMAGATVGLMTNNRRTTSVKNLFAFYRVTETVNAYEVTSGRMIDVGGSGVQSWDVTVYTTDFTCSPGTNYKYDASSFVGTEISLPAGPNNGEEVVLKNVSSSAANVQISGNGNNVEDPTTYSLGATANLSGDGASFRYSFDGTQWLLV